MDEELSVSISGGTLEALNRRLKVSGIKLRAAQAKIEQALPQMRELMSDIYELDKELTGPNSPLFGFDDDLKAVGNAFQSLDNALSNDLIKSMSLFAASLNPHTFDDMLSSGRIIQTVADQFEQKLQRVLKNYGDATVQAYQKVDTGVAATANAIADSVYRVRSTLQTIVSSVGIDKETLAQVQAKQDQLEQKHREFRQLFAKGPITPELVAQGTSLLHEVGKLKGEMFGILVPYQQRAEQALRLTPIPWWQAMSKGWNSTTFDNILAGNVLPRNLTATIMGLADFWSGARSMYRTLNADTREMIVANKDARKNFRGSVKSWAAEIITQLLMLILKMDAQSKQDYRQVMDAFGNKGLNGKLHDFVSDSLSLAADHKLFYNSSEVIQAVGALGSVGASLGRLAKGGGTLKDVADAIQETMLTTGQGLGQSADMLGTYAMNQGIGNAGIKEMADQMNMVAINSVIDTQSYYKIFQTAATAFTHQGNRVKETIGAVDFWARQTRLAGPQIQKWLDDMSGFSKELANPETPTLLVGAMMRHSSDVLAVFKDELIQLNRQILASPDDGERARLDYQRQQLESAVRGYAQTGRVADLQAGMSSLGIASLMRVQKLALQGFYNRTITADVIDEFLASARLEEIGQVMGIEGDLEKIRRHLEMFKAFLKGKKQRPEEFEEVVDKAVAKSKTAFQKTLESITFKTRDLNTYLKDTIGTQFKRIFNSFSFITDLLNQGLDAGYRVGNAPASVEATGDSSGAYQQSDLKSLLASAGSDKHAAFIKAILPGAIEGERKYGVPAAVTIAQAILESGWGKYESGANNIFGIKGKGSAGSRSVKTWEVYGGKTVHITDTFASYNNVAESVEAHGRLLAQNPVYKKAMAAYQQNKDPVQFANLITGIYATDPEYGRKLTDIMRANKLIDAVRNSPPAPAIQPSPTSAGGSLNSQMHRLLTRTFGDQKVIMSARSLAQAGPTAANMDPFEFGVTVEQKGNKISNIEIQVDKATDQDLIAASKYISSELDRLYSGKPSTVTPTPRPASSPKPSEAPPSWSKGGY